MIATPNSEAVIGSIIATIEAVVGLVPSMPTTYRMNDNPAPNTPSATNNGQFGAFRAAIAWFKSLGQMRTVTSTAKAIVRIACGLPYGVANLKPKMNIA